MNGLVILRVVIVAIALVLGIALIARGDVVIGMLVCGLAFARIALFFTIMRRRREFRERFGRRWERQRGGNDRWT